MSQDKPLTPDPALQMQTIMTMDSFMAFCDQIADAKYIAVDTEFVRDKTYYPKLCLIQVASPNAVACIDPLALKDLSPLRSLFTNPGQIKIFHAARQDLEILYAEIKAMPYPIFDTQVAATLLGLGEQIGYANLVKEFLDINLSKQHARADWERRPLSNEQLEYAADDVRYLVQIYPLILKELDKYGRRDWLQNDFDNLADPELYKINLAELWQRVAGNQKLRRKQLAVLQELCIWREQTAMAKDKPRKWILADNQLIAIATQMPASLDKLANIRGLNTAIIDRHGQDIINAVRTALAKPEENWPTPKKRKKLNKNQEATIDALMAIARLKANLHRINVGAILTRNDLEKLVLGEKDIPILKGWRYNLVGEPLMNFLENKLSLKFDNSELTIINNTK